MKKTLVFLISALLLSAIIPFSAFNVNAEGFTDEQGVTYTFYDEGYYIVTDCDESATNVVIPAIFDNIPVRQIGEMAFFNCQSLESIELPNTIRFIDSMAFEFCLSLEEIEIPNSVIAIGNDVFYGCENLKSAVISESVCSIVSNPFINCPSLECIVVKEGNLAFYSENNCLIDKADNKLVSGCKTSIIPDGVTAIATAAFGGCTGLQIIEIPDSVQAIYWYAFEGCKGLKTIEIPDSVESIGSSAFAYCDNLTDIYCPVSILPVGWALDWTANCNATVHWDDDVTKSESSDEQGLIYRLSEDGTYYTVIDCNFSAVNVVIPSEYNGIPVTAIGDGAFMWIENLESIEIPDSVKSIGSYAFWDCKSLKSIELPNSITRIEESTFDNCDALETVIIPDSVTSIGQWAFRHCESLVSITIPASVEHIDFHAFELCENLTDIYCEAESQPDGWDKEWIFACHATVHWKEIIMGDINGNGIIDMTDYILVKRVYFGTYEFTDVQNKVGDISGNGRIDVTDYVLLKRMYFGTYTIKEK